MKRFCLAAMAAALIVLAGGCGVVPLLGDEMSVKISWDTDNCDLGILEPDNITYWVTDSYSPNGSFSYDHRSGGWETWTLDLGHDIGPYQPRIYSVNYTGSVDIEITVNGVTGYGTEAIIPGETLCFLDYGITREAEGRNTLHYTVTREKTPTSPAGDAQ